LIKHGVRRKFGAMHEGQAMFGFGKKAREERAKREVERIGSYHVALINDAMEK